MKKICTGLLMAILTFSLSSALAQGRKADDSADLKALDAKLTDAFKARDVQLLGKHMDDEYILIDPRGGTHSKKEYLKHLAEGTIKYKELNETDVKVRVIGDTAIVTGLLHVKGKVEDKDISADYRWSRVYKKGGDEWRCILEQHTYVLPKEKEPGK